MSTLAAPPLKDCTKMRAGGSQHAAQRPPVNIGVEASSCAATSTSV